MIPIIVPPFMTFLTLIRRSLRFHARAHFGVVLGATIGSAALIGALIIGDSVRETLRQRALQRLANASIALASGDRFISRELESGMLRGPLSRALLLSATQPSPTAAPAEILVRETMLLELPGTATVPSLRARANQVQVFGVEKKFWVFAGLTNVQPPGKDSVILNHELAEQLGAKKGDELLLRVERPGRMSRESAVMQREDQTVGSRLTVAGVLPPGSGGDLDLKAGGTPAMNAFVDIKAMSERAGLGD